MSADVVQIKTRGNSLGMRIASVIARAARLSANQTVRLTVEDGCVVITPLAPRALSLAERLERYDPESHGGEAFGSERPGSN